MFCNYDGNTGKEEKIFFITAVYGKEYKGGKRFKT